MGLHNATQSRVHLQVVVVVSTTMMATGEDTCTSRASDAVQLDMNG